MAIFLLAVFPILALAEAPSLAFSYVSDMDAYLTLPVYWGGSEWLTLGAIGSGLSIITEQLDDKWKKEMTTENHTVQHDRIANIGNSWGDLSLSGPFMLGIYGYGRWTHDEQYLDASKNMLQSAVYTGLMTTGLKLAFHRDRPCQAEDENGWFKHGNSFPSGHTSLAFAVSRSYLNSLEHPSLGEKTLFYGLAASTALARTYDNRHWASDVVAGALLGIYTADYVSNQRKKHHGKYAVAPYMSLESAGLQLTWK